MKSIDNETAILKDTSIVNFKDDGIVELYPSKKWKKPKIQDQYGFGYCHRFVFNDKQTAIEVFIIIEKNLDV